MLVSGDSDGSVIFRNTGCGFTQVSAGDLDGVPGGGGSMGLADLDGDGAIDIVYPTPTGTAYYDNTTPQGHSFTVEVLGPNGEHNQFGRVIQVLPPGTTQIYTRVVDGGSGYLGQNQYPLLVGTASAGTHTVKVYFAPAHEVCVRRASLQGNGLELFDRPRPTRDGVRALGHSPFWVCGDYDRTMMPGG